MGVFGGENGVLGGVLNTVFGGPTGAEGQLGNYANAAFDSREMQRFLPAQLQNAFSGPVLASWIKNLGDLMRTPGGISPTIGAAIRPWLANESQSIAQNYRGLAENQAGAGARGNLPVSIRAALESALGANQERAQRQARNVAMGQSEQLRRQDISSIEPLLQALFQFTSTGRGQAIEAFGKSAEISQKDTGSKLAAMASILGAFAAAGAFSNSRFKEGFQLANENEILDAIQDLPVYKWSYKGEETRHIGPMAEEFMQTFGTGDDPDVLPYVDAIGTLMAATQALARKVERLEAHV